ncbi:glycerol-3-phosphate acyltransferase [Risungbinella massiliensis]|uniref:glycerol-3-phosphate acyltransferase n=1 Tax=Risungbinella massiliensis TaxID=1329796 RepID=UPI0005CC8A36|nr:glycerol-3-phosphate acyltransferase [Risungbinella massiliensis]
MEFFLLLILVYLVGAIPWEKCLGSSFRRNLILWVLLFDFFSAAIVVLLIWWGFGFFAAHLAAILVVLGQMFSCFCKFRERSAYAVAAGALLILSPVLILAGLLFYLLSLLVTRYIILSNFLATIAVIILSFVLATHVTVWFLIIGLGALLLFRQQKNWRKRWRRRKIF